MIPSVVPVVKTTRTSFTGSDARTVLIQHNALVAQMASQGLILVSAPAVKAGVSNAAQWRNEACTLVYRGVNVSVSAAETALTATTHDVAASKEAWFVLSIQNDGSTKTITKAADQTIGTRVLPQVPSSETVLGYMQIITGSGGAFDATTDLLTVSGNIDAIAFYDGPVLALIGDEDLRAIAS